MSRKVKQKNKSEIEHLRGEVKRLTSLNKQLRKRNKELERKSYHYESIVDEIVEDVKVVNKEECERCGNPGIRFLDLKYVEDKVCDECEYRKKL